MSRFLAISFLLACSMYGFSQNDRKAVILRHNIMITKADSSSSIVLGNGGFAFSADITGLQTFPASYRNGDRLQTRWDWGWHSLTDAAQLQSNVGREAGEENKNGPNLFHQNAHLLQFGNIGFEIKKSDGTLATLSDVKSVYQELNLWTGKLRSHFTVEDVPVEVATYCSGSDDAIGVKVQSWLITQGRLKLKVVFPDSPNQTHKGGGNDLHVDSYRSKVLMSHDNGAVVAHQADTSKYYIGFKWEGSGFIEQKEPHYFIIAPDTKSDLFNLTAKFTLKKDLGFLPTFIDVRTSSENAWGNFWNRNANIAKAGRIDRKKNDEERRLVLTQYLLKSTGENTTGLK